jgi:broad specificity phosphatase PhoE
VLLLVRHGETAPNVQGLLLGRADPPLTDRGHTQARAVAAALPRPDLVVSSPLERAVATAAAFGTDVEVDDRWIELDYGDFDGQQPAAVSEDVWTRWRTDVSFAPPGGESLAALGRRVRSACDALMQRATVDVVVVVSHVSPIKVAVAWALDCGEALVWRMYVEDASVARIDLERTGPVLRWFNRGPLTSP